MKLSISLLTFLILFSCNTGQKEVKGYKSSGKLDYIKVLKIGNDTMNYYVKYFREDGTIICEGEKSKGEKIKKWKYFNDKGVIQSIENFSTGLLSDTQVYYFPDGKLDRFKILDQPIPCFCDTQLHYGFTQVAYWKNSKLREVSHIKNCEFNGKTQLYDSIAGTLYKEFFETNGLKNGLFKEFYTDSSVMIGYYQDNKPIGKWKTIRSDSLISEIDYEK
jgi:antitoxin component YwqK of YwqJK toxin-antitoxin module